MTGPSGSRWSREGWEKSQLAHHQKPLVLVSPDGFWDPLLAQFERMVKDGLLKPKYLSIVSVVPDAEGAIEVLSGSADG